jgi:hypothetical protein
MLTKALTARTSTSVGAVMFFTLSGVALAILGHKLHSEMLVAYATGLIIGQVHVSPWPDSADDAQQD